MKKRIGILSNNLKQQSDKKNYISLQERPIRFKFSNSYSFQFMIDRVFHIGKFYLIAGWSEANCEYNFIINEKYISLEKVSIYRRDVNDYLGIKDKRKLGFVLIGQYKGLIEEYLILEIILTEYSFKKTFIIKENALPQNLKEILPIFDNTLFILLQKLEIFSDEWTNLISLLPEESNSNIMCDGAVEFAFYTVFTHKLIIMGWFACEENNILLVQDKNGKTYKISNHYRYYREDVKKHLGNKYGNELNFGSIFIIDNGPSDGSVSLHVFLKKEKTTIGKVTINNTGYDIDKLIISLFSLPVSISEFLKISYDLYQYILLPCIRFQQEQWKNIPIEVRSIGKSSSSNDVSVIIPLYGRYDFVEYQLIDFMQDEWFKNHCELIYTIDDNYILTNFIERMEQLFRIYGFPMKCVWGGVNKGLSGANNLGASIAKSETLLFLNSDVFPKTPNWIQGLYKALYSSSNNGAVGGRLLGIDGSLQHAGTRFQKRREMGIWMIDYPFEGCAPSFDPVQSPIAVPSITNACLMIRQKHFTQINGWDQEYLINCFQGGDLCLKLQEIGLNTIYCPDIELTHLKNCIFSIIEQNQDVNYKAKIYDAMQFKNKWKKSLIQSKKNNTI